MTLVHWCSEVYPFGVLVLGIFMHETLLLMELLITMPIIKYILKNS